MAEAAPSISPIFIISRRMDSMGNAFRLVAKSAKSPEFREASATAERLRQGMEKASRFAAPGIASEASEFFSALRKKSPGMYRMLRAQELGIQELEVEKRTGRRVVMD